MLVCRIAAKIGEVSVTLAMSAGNSCRGDWFESFPPNPTIKPKSYLANNSAVFFRRETVLADFGDLALQSEDLDDVLMEACRLVAEALRLPASPVHH